MKYSKDILSLVLYPLKNAGLNDEQIEILNGFFEGLNSDDLTEMIHFNITSEKMIEIAGRADKSEKKSIFEAAKKILGKKGIFFENMEALAELGNALGIESGETGFDFDIYDAGQRKDYEFQKTVNNFSIVASAVGFIPFIPVADFFILTPIQIGLISKISNLYGYKVIPKEFLKMVSGTVGIGLAFKITASVINRLIPYVGWIVNATVAFAGTYAIGILAKHYIESNGELTKESINEIWKKSYEEGKDEFKKFKGYIFVKKDDLIKEIKKYISREKDTKADTDTDDFEKENSFSDRGL